MTANQKEEIQYCNYCGAANKKSDFICCECNKKIHTTYKPFYDFLKKHTKDEIAGNITESVLSYIKNFLLSHLYGVAISVAIVATAVSAVSAAQPHVKKVSQVKTAQVVQGETVKAPVTEQTEQQPEAQVTPLSEDDLYDFYQLSGNYDAFVDELRASDAYWETGDNVYGSVAEMYAENNIEGFNYRGVHEMISNPIPMHTFDMDPAYADMEFSQITSDRYMDNASAVQGEQCTTEIAKTLHSQGYQVAECNYVLCEASGEYDAQNHTGGDVVKKLVYKFVFVRHGDSWYIVEDRLVDRVNV